MDTDDCRGPVFLPSNEPYLGRESVYQFDQVVVWAMEHNTRIAGYTWGRDLLPLQRAACQVVPQGINLALAIRELVRQGYLFPAAVLLRPLMERAGIISYLAVHPEAIPVWEGGWLHRQRPSLRQMLEAMAPEAEDRDRARAACDVLNHLVHGDPYAAGWGLSQVGEDAWGYSVGKLLDSPGLCDFVSFTACMFLIVIVGRAVECFPESCDSGPCDA